ncbi:MAG TPA: Hsp20/alpha crystallin family protein [Ktedonobacterales bacterium]|jgi:HSP20 family protein
METMIRWQPGETLTTLRQAIEKLLDETFAQPLETITEDGDPLTSTTLYQTDRNYLVKTGLPDTEPDQVEVTVRSNQVSIKSEVTHTRHTRIEGCTKLERTVERFFRSVALPGVGDIEGARAVLEHGVLTVTVPKAPAPPSRRLVVEVGEQEAAES